MTKCEQFKQQTNKYPSRTAERRPNKWLFRQRQALNGKGGGRKMDE